MIAVKYKKDGTIRKETFDCWDAYNSFAFCPDIEVLKVEIFVTENANLGGVDGMVLESFWGVAKNYRCGKTVYDCLLRVEHNRWFNFERYKEAESLYGNRYGMLIKELKGITTWALCAHYNNSEDLTKELIERYVFPYIDCRVREMADAYISLMKARLPYNYDIDDKANIYFEGEPICYTEDSDTMRIVEEDGIREIKAKAIKEIQDRYILDRDAFVSIYGYSNQFFNKQCEIA